jgi:hypothetical protein
MKTICMAATLITLLAVAAQFCGAEWHVHHHNKLCSGATSEYNLDCNLPLNDPCHSWSWNSRDPVDYSPECHGYYGTAILCPLHEAGM